MISILHKTLKDSTVKFLDEFKPGSWVYVENPTEEELERISRDYKLDRGLLKDALDPHEVSRVDVDEGVDYIFARYAREENGSVFTEPILLIISADSLITVCRKKPDFYDKFIAGKVEFFTTQKTKLFIQILLDIIQNYQQILNHIRKQIRVLTTDLEKIKNQDVINFVTYEATLYDMLTSLEPMGSTLKTLLSRRYMAIFEQDKDLVEDLQLGTEQLVDLCQSTLSHIVNVRNGYSTIISNNLNKTMKLLTFLTLILTIPTMIASFFGMNVPLPMQQHELAFIAIFLLALFITGLLSFILSRRHYL